MSGNPARHSNLRKEPRYKPAHSLHAFYEGLTRPASVVTVLFAYLALINKDDIIFHLTRAVEGDSESLGHLSLLLLSLMAGLRVVQSLLLAKRDYAHLEHGIVDLGIFICVLLFASGGVLYLAKDNYPAILLIYTTLAFVGAGNFVRLWGWHIPSDNDSFDYPIERRIQALNALIFSILALLLAWTTHSSFRSGGTLGPEMTWTAAIGIILLIVNMLHSEQLTLLPKFLLKNDVLSDVGLRSALQEGLSLQLPRDVDLNALRALLGNHLVGLPSISTVRVAKSDVTHISNVLVKEFGYVFEYIFGTNDIATLSRTLRSLLLAAGGLGRFGYLSFYWVLDESGARVALVKFDTNSSNWIYRFIETVEVPVRLVLALHTVRLISLKRRFAAALTGQHSPKPKEVILTYFVTLPGFRRKGYARAAMHLFQSACLYAFTNDIVADKITLFVRSTNRAARKLFTAAGFEVQSREVMHDPLAAMGAGKLLKMEARCEMT